jgi:sporulation protein YlmC with PRC-barrel domain
MKLIKDAKILNSEGKEVGNLNRFVLDPKTKQITHIVFEQGMLSKTEHVLPMDLVEHIDDDGIHMRETGAKADELPLFEENQYIITNERALNEEGVISDPTIHSYYHYPSIPPNDSHTMNVYQHPDQLPRPVPGSVPGIGRRRTPVVKNPDQNIPDGTVALKEGAKVVSSDRHHVGDIEKVIVDPNTETATHLLITKGLLNREKKLIPLDWVEQILEEEVELTIAKEFVENLPEYKEE